MKLILTIKTPDQLTVGLKRGNKVIDQESLTISQGFDNMLIVAIDKILSRNRMVKLSLRTLVLPAKLKDGAVSTMILGTTKAGLEV